jgi:hypothetical protein
MRKDLRRFSEDELSLMVFNDEYLYNRRFKGGLRRELESMFYFSAKQYKILKDDIASDKEEIEQYEKGILSVTDRL